MLYLLLAIVTGAAVSIIMRLSGEKITNNVAMLAVSYLAGAALALLNL